MDRSLTADEAKMKQAFNLFDRDGDGKISQTELGEVLQTVGKEATPEELRQLIGGSVEGMFTARGGSIDFKTFLDIVVRAAIIPPRAIFFAASPPSWHFDVSHFFSRDPHFIHVCFSLARSRTQTGTIKGEGSGEITDLQEAFKLLDKGNKGYITETELCKVCEKLGESLTEEEAAEMVGEALIGYEGKIYYDGLLKILITQ